MKHPVAESILAKTDSILTSVTFCVNMFQCNLKCKHVLNVDIFYFL